jgi:predicted ATPase
MMSELNDMRKQFQNGNWKKFLNKITIDKLRGWNNQAVEFHFPICAIVGENGSGKTTVLRAVACAYENNLDVDRSKSNYPSKYFLNTQWDRDSVPMGTTITYMIKEGERTSTDSKWKKTQDWGYSPKGKRPGRAIVFLDISRTLPLDATAGYAKIAKQTAEAIAGNELVISDDLMKQYSHIMSENYSSGKFVQPLMNKNVGLLTTEEHGQISQFHQGAGEDALLDLMRILQTIPNTALLIIDEVDASLHPKAQRRLVRFLVQLARQKKIQVILSTHSPYILEEIPPEGRILIQKLSDGTRNIQYGVSTNYAMGLIDDERHPDLFIYVEDREAKILVQEMLRQESIFSRIDIIEVGDVEVVKTMGKLCRNKKLPNRGIAILDGDAGPDANSNCLYLPSDKAPEKLVFEDLKAKEWSNLDKRFGMGAGQLFSIFGDALTKPDHHEIASYIGDRVSKSKDYVWSVFVEEWCKQCLSPNDRESIVLAVKDILLEIDAS